MRRLSQKAINIPLAITIDLPSGIAGMTSSLPDGIGVNKAEPQLCCIEAIIEFQHQWRCQSRFA